jgi:hypothetical protein
MKLNSYQPLIKRAFTLFATMILASILTGCNNDKSDAEKVANAFWQNFSSEQYDNAARSMLSPSTTTLRFSRVLIPADSIELSKVEVKGNVAMAITVLGQGEEQRQIITVLQKVNEQWLVDFSATKKSWSKSLVNDLKSGLRDSADWLDNQMDDAFNDLDELLTPLDDLEFDFKL